jgi:type VII secretion protein EccB
MAGKRDQLQAHRFLVQRVISALVTRETDPEQPPLRRPWLAAAGSLALAVLILAGWGIYGFVVPGGNRTWRTGDAVIVVKETGARYVYVDGRLHPVLNYASALLALGRHGQTRTVSRKSLVGVPRGPRIGIPDAPDALPEPAGVLRSGWSLCSAPGADETGARVDDTVLLAGTDPAGGRPLDDAALLVEVPEIGDQYLIRHGYRHRIRRSDAVPVALALRARAPARVGPAVVDVLAAGAPIAPIPVPDAGKPSTAVPRRPDLRVGQLVVAETAGDAVQHYLVTGAGLRPITPLQFDIQLADGKTARAYPGAEPAGVPLGLTAAAGARMEPQPAPSPGAAPARRPAFAGAAETICVTYDAGATTAKVRVGATLPPADATVRTPGRTAEGLPLADRVFVPPGRAALAEVGTGTLVLVTDQGRGHPLASRDVLGMLGYGRLHPARLPDGLVTRVPLGSVLDPVAARSP